MCGIQTSLQNHDFFYSGGSRRRKKSKKILDFADWNSPKFTETVTHLLNYMSVPGVPPPTTIDNSGRWIFTEYCPHVFWKIREALGVSTTEYDNSLGLKKLVGNLLLGRLQSYQEVCIVDLRGLKLAGCVDGT